MLVSKTRQDLSIIELIAPIRTRHNNIPTAYRNLCGQINRISRTDGFGPFHCLMAVGFALKFSIGKGFQDA